MTDRTRTCPCRATPGQVPERVLVPVPVRDRPLRQLRCLLLCCLRRMLPRRWSPPPHAATPTKTQRRKHTPPRHTNAGACAAVAVLVRERLRCQLRGLRHPHAMVCAICPQALVACRCVTCRTT